MIKVICRVWEKNQIQRVFLVERKFHIALRDCSMCMLENEDGQWCQQCCKTRMRSLLLAMPIFVFPPAAFPWPVALLSSSLFFSGAWSCYRQDKAGLPELGLSIIPLPSSEKKGGKKTVFKLINTQLKKRGGIDGERERRQQWRKWKG